MPYHNENDDNEQARRHSYPETYDFLDFTVDFPNSLPEGNTIKNEFDRVSIQRLADTLTFMLDCEADDDEPLAGTDIETLTKIFKSVWMQHYTALADGIFD